VIAICRSGHRSAAACGRLRKAGFERVFNLQGGVNAWKNAGLPMRGGKKK
jgi:rhodanese-related sulfurtransferase